MPYPRAPQVTPCLWHPVSCLVGCWLSTELLFHLLLYLLCVSDADSHSEAVTPQTTFGPVCTAPHSAHQAHGQDLWESL